MRAVKNDIFEAVAAGGKLLAVLIDPDKFEVDDAADFLRKIPRFTTHLFVGGSSVEAGKTEACVQCR